MTFGRVILGGWSAGCGAIRQILKTPESYARVDTVLLIDGIHTDYVDGKPGPLESKIGSGNLDIWLQLGRDAIAGRKRVLITHSEIFPGTFASTTETADYLVVAARSDSPRRAEVGTDGLAAAQRSEGRQVPDGRLRRKLRAGPCGPVALAAGVSEVDEIDASVAAADPAIVRKVLNALHMARFCFAMLR